MTRKNVASRGLTWV